MVPNATLQDIQKKTQKTVGIYTSKSICSSLLVCHRVSCEYFSGVQMRSTQMVYAYGTAATIFAIWVHLSSAFTIKNLIYSI